MSGQKRVREVRKVREAQRPESSDLKESEWAYCMESVFARKGKDSAGKRTEAKRTGAGMFHNRKYGSRAVPEQIQRGPERSRRGRS